MPSVILPIVDLIDVANFLHEFGNLFGINIGKLRGDYNAHSI